MTIGERIRSRRIELGLSQEELANKLGNKSRASVSTVENDKEDLTTDRIRKYAEALEVSPAYLMGWEDEKSVTVSVKAANQGEVDEALKLYRRYQASDEELKDIIDKLLNITRARK